MNEQINKVNWQVKKAVLIQKEIKTEANNIAITYKYSYRASLLTSCVIYIFIFFYFSSLGPQNR